MLTVAAVLPNGYNFDISGQFIALFNRLIGLFIHPTFEKITFILCGQFRQCRYGVIGSLCQQFLNGSHRRFISAGVGTGDGFGGYFYLKARKIRDRYNYFIFRQLKHGDGLADSVFAGSADTLSLALKGISRSEHGFPFAELMSCLLDNVGAVGAFFPMFVSSALILIIMFYCPFLAVYPTMPTGAAMGSVTAGGTGRLGNS